MTAAVPRRPRHAVPALALLLAATAALYVWGLDRSGWANEFYAAAVQAGTHDPTALLFGALDPAGGITVDKPPAALWVMGVSARLFGFSPWSLLVPQALEGVAAVALLYAAVARGHGRPAGLAAGAILAVTPVATVMFRMDDPDALMILLLVAAAYAALRACEGPGARRPGPAAWMALCGLATGFAFLTKMAQGLIAVPALAAVFAVCAALPLRRRLAGLAAAAAGLVAGAGWYVALVALWPAGSRPYIGGSTDDSLLQLALDYNGLGRLTGGDGNPAIGGRGTGAGRLFGESMGAQISWLLPAALAGLAVLAAVGLRAPRTDRARAAAILWGGWLLTGGVVLSTMQGIVHSYYTAMLAPPIAALVATGGAALWHRRGHPAARLTAAVTLAVTGVWAFVLLGRTPLWLPWLRWVVVVGSAAGAVVLAGAALLPAVTAAPARVWARAGAAGCVLACAAALLAPAAYSVASAAQPHGGSSPSAGPTGGPAFARGPGDHAGIDSPDMIAAVEGAGTRWAAATVGASTAARLELETDRPVLALGGYTGRDPSPTLAQFQADVAAGRIRYFLPRAGLDLFSDLLLGGADGEAAGGGPGIGAAAGAGAGLTGATARLLVGEAPAGAARPRPHGGGPAGHGAPPGPAFAPPARGGRGGAETESSRITSWVEARFATVTLGGMTVYDLSRPLAPA